MSNGPDEIGDTVRFLTKTAVVIIVPIIVILWVVAKVVF